LIQNPSLAGPLEPNGLPKGWYRFTNMGGNYRVTVVDEGRTDTRSLRLEGEGQYAGATVNKVPVDPASEYAARCWVKVEGAAGTRANLKLDLFDAQGKYLKSTPSEYVP